MKSTLLKATILGLLCTGMSWVNATSIEGYWKSIDDSTGEPLSIIEIRKKQNGTYTGTIIKRLSTRNTTLATCAKCPAPFKDKPIEGLEILNGLKDDPAKPDYYIDGMILDAKSGNLYRGKAHTSKDGRRLHMRGFMGTSVLGRTQIWIRADKPNS